MPRLDYKRCKECGRHASECGLLSHTRLCIDCGNLLRNEASVSLALHRGPKFHNWRRGMAASVGAILPDDSTAA